MSEFEEIQNLIRLKRHERPPEGFVEDFLTSFQQRQRSELLQQSARGLLWERVTTYFADFLNPRWAWAGATVASVALLGITLRPHTVSGPQIVQSQPEGGFEVRGFATTDPDAFKANVENYLKAVEYEPDNGSAPQMVMKPRIVQPQHGGEMIPAGLGYRPGFIIQH